MAIVKMKKFSLMTFESYRNELLRELQRFQDVHFKNLQGEDLSQHEFLKRYSAGSEIAEYESQLSKVRFTLGKIEPHKEKVGMVKALSVPPVTMTFSEFDSFADRYDYTAAYEKVKALDEEIKRLNQEITKKQVEIEGLKSWAGLDVSPAELNKLRGVKWLAGSVSKIGLDSFREGIERTFDKVYLEAVGSVKDDISVLLLAPASEIEDVASYAKTLGFSRLSLGFSGVPEDLMAQYRQEIGELSAQEAKTLDEIKLLSGEYDNLKSAEDFFRARLERAKACANFLKSQEILIIEGWVPENAFASFEQIVQRVCGDNFYMETEEVPHDSEEVPIKLKNNRLVKAFEDITEMYSLPKYNELDPTPVITPFYLLFFGLMLGDIGYGLVLIIGSLLGLRLLKPSKGMKNFLSFFFYLGISTTLAGFLYGGFFGFTVFAPMTIIENGVAIKKPILDSGRDIITMMIMSIIIGVFQIIFGLLVKGYMLVRDGKIWAAIFDSLFWIIAVLSGIGYLLGMAGMISPEMTNIIKWVFFGSLLGLAATQGRDSPSLGGKIGNGLYSVYGMTSYVGDIVSYTRIIALALSGAYIAQSFNIMAGLFPKNWLGVIVSALVVILGGTLNIGLSALGAYVHTCRLQYVEFFGKFYEGGGVPFAPLEIKNSFVEITDNK